MATIEDEIKRFDVHKRHSQSITTEDSFPSGTFAITYKNKLFLFYENIDMSEINESYKSSVTSVLVFHNGGNDIEAIFGESHYSKNNGRAIGFYINEDMFKMCMGPYRNLVQNSILNHHN